MIHPVFKRSAPAILAIGLLGCSNDLEDYSAAGAALSIEEALKITAKFSKAEYIPAQRTIDDIRKSIGKPRAIPENCKSILREQDETLNEVIGQIGGGAGSASWRESRRATSVATVVNREFQRGNYKDMISHIETAVSRSGNAERIWRGQYRVARPMYRVLLAKMLVEIGDNDQAVSSLKAARGELKGAGGGRYSSYQGFNETRNYAAAKAILPIIGAYLAQIAGKWDIAEANFRVAYHNRFFLPSEKASLAVRELRAAIAQNLLQQGRVAEAEFEIRASWKDEYNDYKLYKRNKAIKYKPLPLNLAISTAQLAEVMLVRGRYADARYLAEIAVNIQESNCAAPESVGLSKARRLLAQTRAAEGDWGAILTLFERARVELSGNVEAFDRLYGDNLEWAMALSLKGDAEEAIRRLRAAGTQYAGQEEVQGRRDAQIRGVLGIAYATRGEFDQASKFFAQSTPLLMKRQDGQNSGYRKRVEDVRNREILMHHMAFLAESPGATAAGRWGIDPTSEMFRIANYLKIGIVQNALSASAARRSISDPDMADLVRREQDTAQHIEATLDLLSTLELAPRDQVDYAVLSSVRQRFVDLTNARAAILQEISIRFPDYHDLLNPSPTSLEQAVAALRSNEALITLHVGETETLVWAVPKSGKVQFARLPVSSSWLAEKVASLRIGFDADIRTLGDIRPYDIGSAYELYDALLKPVEVGWQNARELLIISNGVLTQLPFSLLATEKYGSTVGGANQALFADYRAAPWLIRRVAVVHLPSVNALVSLRSRAQTEKKDRRALAAFADPYFSQEQAIEARRAEVHSPEVQIAAKKALDQRGRAISRRSAPNTRGLASADLANLPRLPETAEEVLGIARSLGADIDKDIFLGERANEQVVKTIDLSNRRVIVFATHGLVSGDLDGLAQPALALTAPEVANIEGDGLLTMAEIMGLRLDSDWVVLSACNTAAAEGKGAEAISGLGRAFFYAGARALLVSNWSVETTSAKALTTDIFRRQAEDPTLSRAQALRQAMLGLIDGPGYVDDNGRTIFSYAHPIFWAPFTIVGDGGGALTVTY